MPSIEDRIQAKMAEIRLKEAKQQVKDAEKLLEEAIERQAIRRLAKEKKKEEEDAQLRIAERKRIDAEVKQQIRDERITAVRDVFMTYWSTQATLYTTLDEKRKKLSDLGITINNIKSYLPEKVAQNEYYVAKIFSGPPEITFNEHYRLTGYQSPHYMQSPQSCYDLKLY
jgi:hypothetical protein